MLAVCGVNKTLICTPSNSALDEIVTRLAGHGLGLRRQELVSKLLRIQSGSEYDLHPDLKQYELRTKLAKEDEEFQKFRTSIEKDESPDKKDMFYLA